MFFQIRAENFGPFEAKVFTRQGLWEHPPDGERQYFSWPRFGAEREAKCLVKSKSTGHVVGRKNVPLGGPCHQPLEIAPYRLSDNEIAMINMSLL